MDGCFSHSQHPLRQGGRRERANSGRWCLKPGGSCLSKIMKGARGYGCLAPSASSCASRSAPECSVCLDFVSEVCPVILECPIHHGSKTSPNLHGTDTLPNFSHRSQEIGDGWLLLMKPRARKHMKICSWGGMLLLQTDICGLVAIQGTV